MTKLKTTVIFIMLLTFSFILTACSNTTSISPQRDAELHSDYTTSYTLINNEYLCENFKERTETNIKGTICLSNSTFEKLVKAHNKTIRLGTNSKITIVDIADTELDYVNYIEDREKVYICGDINIKYYKNSNTITEDNYYVKITVDNIELKLANGIELNNIDESLSFRLDTDDETK